MNLKTTCQEPRMPLLYGWLGSISLHGLLLLSFLPLVRQSLISVPKESFHWDVALVQWSQKTDESVHTIDATDQVLSKPAERAPMPARAVRTTPRAATSADRIVPIEPRTAEQVAPTFQPPIASSAVSPSEATTARISDEPTSNLAHVSAPPLQQIEPSTGSTTQEPQRSAEASAATATYEEPAPASEAAPPPSAPAVDATVASTTGPDYGWLQQAIFRRLEELKRSSRPLLDESRPLRVTVKAVVSREGTLLDSVIVKSSGLDRIDQEALALVQRTFPMQFDRALDRQQIVMRIPITYSQE